MSPAVAVSVSSMNTTNGKRMSSSDTFLASSVASIFDTSGPDTPIKKAPVTHKAMPMTFVLDIASCRKTCARTADRTTLHAPSGATRDAGAKPNAVKLPISPAAIRKVPIHHVGLRRNAKLLAVEDDESSVVCCALVEDDVEVVDDEEDDD